MTNNPGSTESSLIVYLGLGSNIGDRLANLREAVARIKRLGVEVLRQSSIYETEPVGLEDQPWFLNQVIEGRISAELERELNVRQSAGVSETPSHVAFEADDKSANCRRCVAQNPETIGRFQAEALLAELLKIESALGRERTIVNGPRVIDIDLLLLGDKVINNSKETDNRSGSGQIEVVVPHPRMHTRRFVLEPLCEIAPESIHPLLKKTCREILALLDDPSIVRRHNPVPDIY